MNDDHTPKHLRGLPDSRRRSLPPERGRELMDLQTGLDRDRRRRESERDPDAPESWAFPVPRPMALLFDRLGSPFTVEDALAEGKALGMDAGAVEGAVEQMKAQELVSPSPAGYVRHAENRNWF